MLSIKIILLSIAVVIASRCPSSKFIPKLRSATTPKKTPGQGPKKKTASYRMPINRSEKLSTVLPGPRSNVMQYILQQTNIIREWHGVKPLVWDQQLANGVQRGANKCRGFKHFKENEAWQNLASGSPCASTSADGNCKVQKESEPWRWYKDEEKLWNYETKNCGKDWTKCGHFVIETAPEQQRMGCAFSNCGAYGGTNVWCDYKGLSSKNPTIPRPKGSNAQLEQRLKQHYASFIASQSY